MLPAIVHRDIKTHNILLVAEVGGIGGVGDVGEGGGGDGGSGVGGGGGGGGGGGHGPRVSARLCDWGLTGTDA
ncbi:hypothetical protein T492DRAFT_862610 [Pavlovales sp. CCMP2436]|nr:hypothetical protein T492DRAFT_862610 [Pavlovales sp. CCMP2436]